MKISVLGNVIDTEDIYRISAIHIPEYVHIHFSFTIFFFNRKELYVSLYSECYIQSDNQYMVIGEKNFCANKDKVSRDVLVQSEIYQEKLKQITDLRDKIIAYWSDNQSTIPRLEFT